MHRNLNLKKHHKLIIFPASRPITQEEEKDINTNVSQFLANWSAHGNPLSSSLKIIYQQFIIISVDENQEPASGCSLDALNGVMREIEQKHSLGIFNRMKVCYIEKQEIKTISLQDFRKNLKSGVISKDIQVFDFSKSDGEDFTNSFLLPLKESWAKDF